MRRIAWIFALLLVLSGCWPKPAHPKLHIRDAHFVGVELTLRPLQVRLRAELTVEAENPNSFDIQVRNLRGTLRLADRHDLPLDEHPNLWLPSEQTTPFVLPVELPVQVALSLLKTTISTECIPYRLDAEVDLTASSSFKLERDNYPLRKDSCIPRKNLIEAAAKLGI